MRFPVALAAMLLALPALAQDDPRFGRWPCFFGAESYGVLSLSSSGYSLSGAPDHAGTGRLHWDGDLFHLASGPLLEGGVTGGLVFPSPDRPGVWSVDLYSDLGVVLDCRKR